MLERIGCEAILSKSSLGERIRKKSECERKKKAKRGVGRWW